jgi:hypothetical protein
MEIPLDAFLLPKEADPFHKDWAIYLDRGYLVFRSLKEEHHEFYLKENLLPDLIDILINLQNKE